MIKFSCKNCGQKLNVEDKHSGKRVKCPKCGSLGIVPDSSDKIKFHCESCGQSIRAPQIHAGKKVRCPKCKNPIVIPSLKRESVGSAVSGPSIPSETDEDLYEDESDLPEEGEGLDRSLILVICGGAALVVVGLIILFAVVLPSGSGRIEETYAPPRQEAVDVDSQSNPVASDTQPTVTSTLQPPKEDIAPKEPAQSKAEASDDTRNLDLKLRLKTGQKHSLQIVNEIKSSQTTKGRQTDQNYINTKGLELKVEQVDNKGVAWLKVTYLTIHEITKTARGQIEYDSTKPDTAVSYPNWGPVFTAIIGQSFVAKVTPKGDIVELEGLAEMYQRMAELVVEKEDEATRQRMGMAEASTKEDEERAKKSIDRKNQRYGSREKRIEATGEKLEEIGFFTKKLIREMLGNVIMPFPSGPVGIGDSWQSRMALFSIGAGDLGLDDCTYTLRENKQAALLVDFSSKIDLDDEPLSPEAESRATLKGSCEGSLEIDLSNGWMLHKNVTMHCSGEIRYPPTERVPQGLTTRLSMEIVTTVKPIE
ncbi:MAG: hypothetical protein GY774_28650 [Planctomycetes bacterium]|nr:hypothetical protein [Planctomycetota bacterium]